MTNTKNKNANELVQYFVVNKDLNMSPGKIAAQVAHGCMLVALRDQSDKKFQEWFSDDMRKIVLKGSEKEILKLKDKISGSILIVDKGFTEIEPNSKTVLALPVMTRKETYAFVKRLQLL